MKKPLFTPSGVAKMTAFVELIQKELNEDKGKDAEPNIKKVKLLKSEQEKFREEVEGMVEDVPPAAGGVGDSPAPLVRSRDSKSANTYSRRQLTTVIQLFEAMLAINATLDDKQFATFQIQHVDAIKALGLAENYGILPIVNQQSFALVRAWETCLKSLTSADLGVGFTQFIIPLLVGDSPPIAPLLVVKQYRDRVASERRIYQILMDGSTHLQTFALASQQAFDLVYAMEDRVPEGKKKHTAKTKEVTPPSLIDRVRLGQIKNHTQLMQEYKPAMDQFLQQGQSLRYYHLAGDYLSYINVDEPRGVPFVDFPLTELGCGFVQRLLSGEKRLNLCVTEEKRWQGVDYVQQYLRRKIDGTSIVAFYKAVYVQFTTSIQQIESLQEPASALPLRSNSSHYEFRLLSRPRPVEPVAPSAQPVDDTISLLNELQQKLAAEQRKFQAGTEQKEFHMGEEGTTAQSASYAVCLLCQQYLPKFEKSPKIQQVLRSMFYDFAHLALCVTLSRDLVLAKQIMTPAQARRLQAQVDQAIEHRPAPAPSICLIM